MRSWLHAHGEAIVQTFRQFRRQPITALLSIAVIGIGLLFPVGGHIAVANLKALAGGAGTDPQISLFLATEAGPADRTEIERRLRLEAGIKSYRLIGKESALKDLQSRTGSADLMAGLAANPLPDTYLIAPREVSTLAQSRLADTLRTWPSVAEVDVDAVWTDRLRLLASTGEVMVLGLGAILGLAMLAISFNTIRLQVLTRSEEIAVLRLFGATGAFIRRPFLYFGAFQGVTAALFAWSVAGGWLPWVEPRLAVLLEAYGLTGRLVTLAPMDGLSLIGFSALVGMMGAWLATAEG